MNTLAENVPDYRAMARTWVEHLCDNGGTENAPATLATSGGMALTYQGGPSNAQR